MENAHILFLCDGGNPKCRYSKKCHVQGGTCRHTSDPLYAKSFKIEAEYDDCIIYAEREEEE